MQYEVSVSREASELKKDDLFALGGQVCKVLATRERVGQAGSIHVRFKLKSDVSSDFYTMWINSKYKFEVLIPKRT